jgi:hypothetical protein
MATWPTATPLPDGARLLDTEQAVEAIVLSDHPEAHKGDIEIDNALVTLIRDGRAVVARLADGTLIFNASQEHLDSVFPNGL